MTVGEMNGMGQVQPWGVSGEGRRNGRGELMKLLGYSSKANRKKGIPGLQLA